MKLFAQTLKLALARMSLLIQDLILLSAALFFAYWIRFGLRWALIRPETNPQDITAYWYAFFLAIYLVITQMLALKLYAVQQFRTWHEDYNGIIRATSIAALLLLALSFFYRTIDYSRQMVLMAWPLAAVFLCLGRSLFRGFFMLLKKQGFFTRRVLLLGRGAMLPVILEKMADNKHLALEPVGIIAEKNPAESKYFQLSYFGNLDDFERVLEKEDIHVIFMIQENVEHKEILEIIEICEKYHVELLLIPQVFDLLIGYSNLKDFQGLPMVELREEPINWGVLFLKRWIDFFLGGFLLVFSLPLQMIIGILIKLDSRGPILYFQERVGYRGKKFQMLKFRTMTPKADEKLSELVEIDDLKEPVFKLKNDPRVTRIGKWLRKTSLDELPQLWNVLIGQMSLVGPRPEEIKLVQRYNVWQRRRLKVKPGITGFQQIKCRGSPSLAERVKYDIYYIRRLSLLLDFEIMVRTVWVVLRQRGAH